ncbi:MAG: hypothetical protein ABI846_05990 [Rudaea sp.]
MQLSARNDAVDTRQIPQARIARALVAAWFAIGCVALLLAPGLRGSDPWLGWLPFWLVGVPAIEWALLRLNAHSWRSLTAAEVRIRTRHAAAARGPSSRRVRKAPARATRVRAKALLTALFVREAWVLSP